MENVVVPINMLLVFLAAVSSMVIGWLWYGPVFGKPWMKMMGFTQASMDEAKKKGMGKAYGLMFVGSLVMAYTLAHSLVFASTYMHVMGYPAGLMSGFWSWFGFVAPVTMGGVLWEGKSWKLWALNNGYYLVTLLAMGCILSGK